MELEQIIISTILIGVVMFSITASIGYFNQHYNINVESTYSSIYDRANENMQRVNQSEDILFSSGAKEEFGFVPTIEAVMKIGALIKNSVSDLKQMVYGLSTYLGIPPYITIALGSLLTVGLIFAIIKITMRVMKV